MERVVSSTIHQFVEFEWDHIEVVIHGELSHSVYSTTTSPIIEELNGATFHAIEIMQVVKVREKIESNELKMSKIAKMVATETVKYGYQPKNRLGV
ncbi:hypothetical protein HAX54_035928, partial [Datura stramonium]|nr:hypothetical protein [Datura stramonium]